MSSIVDKIKEEVIRRSNKFQENTKRTKDEYNLYSEHIKYVYKYACMIAENKNVDIEIIKLSALLHDISMTDITLDRDKHNEYSSVIAEKLLRENHYPEEKIILVKKCILNHSNKRKNYRTTKEEQILVDADAMAHFDCLLSLYSLGVNVIGLDEISAIQFVKDKIIKDYNEISEEAKNYVKDKYEKIMEIDSYEELELL